jgi:hypothetical protein
MIELDDLDDLFDDLSIDGPTPNQLNHLYSIFINDFSLNPIFINGIRLRYNNNRSNHPICKGKAQAFEHIITRESKYSQKRNFDANRANKIHWIKPIIENSLNPRIKYFEEINHNNQKQLFFWFKEKDFVVIVRAVNPNFLLITAYLVDSYERKNFSEKYLRFKKA